MDIRTKIVCTIGPSVDTYEKLLELAMNGMDVARLNFSHGTHEEHLQRIELIKKVRSTLKKPLAIMLDTKGPEVRLGKIAGDETKLKTGQRWILQKETVLGDSERVTMTPPAAFNHITVGSTVLFDNGYIGSKVVEHVGDTIVVEIINGGIIKSNKSINLPLSKLDLPILGEKDVADLKFGLENDIDMIAISFTRSAEDIFAIREMLSKFNKTNTLLIAKIENHEGVSNIETILQAADGLMVARGDLGVEVPMPSVPKLQKMMLRKCYLLGKPGITATQMLESMIKNPRPTRAEASDVANAIYDATAAVMLSGETAMGDYPIECVQMMRSIAAVAESDFDYLTFFNQYATKTQIDIPGAVTLATIKTAYSLNAKAIFVFTSSGATARLLSRLRPSIPIVAMTASEKCYHQMSILWGVIPVLGPHCKHFAEAYDTICGIAMHMGIVSFGDLVIVTCGAPFGIAGTTNAIIVENVGNVLVRASKGTGKKGFGQIKFLTSPESGMPFAYSNKVIIVPKWDDAFKPFAMESAAIVLQNIPEDEESEKHWLEFAESINKPCVVGVVDSFHHLKEEAFVTVDPVKAIIYKEK